MFFLLIACSEHDLKVVPEPEAPPFVDSGEPYYEPTEQPDIHVDPPVADFGGIMKDCPSEWLDLEIQNRGLADLEISGIALTGDGSAAFFQNADQLFQDGKIIIPFGESIPVKVRFTPEYFINYESILEIDSNDPDESTFEIPTTGKGTAGPQMEESFTQQFNQEVDVLWVFDTSSSMDDNIQNVQQNFQSFIGGFLNLGLDYNMAIITTDAGLNGTFQSNPLILDSSMGQSAVTQTFNTTLTNLGTDGSTTEVGLQVTKDALDNQSQSQLFMRGDTVGLSVIIVSDEDDNGSNIQGQQFISWFQGLKSDSNLIRMHGFLSSGGSLGGGNPIYEEVISATQGHTADIDSTSYETALEEIAYAAAGMIVSYPLQQTPFPPSSITVEGGDGTIIPKDLLNGWTYNSRTNMIEFHGDAIPDFDETVIITYEVEGTCEN
jgi:hypothetical protein